MKRYIIFSVLIFYFFSCFSQSNRLKWTDSIVVDANIKNDGEKYFKKYKNIENLNGNLIYEMPLYIEIYKDGKLLWFRNFKSDKNIVFKSGYFWHGDTLIIEGTNGIDGGTGFIIKYYKGKTKLYNLLITDKYDSKFPNYAYGIDDSLKFRVEIPWTKTKIILSEIPKYKLNKIIYGYVEFDGNEFYQCDRDGAGVKFEYQKLRTKMKIYFKSSNLNLLK